MKERYFWALAFCAWALSAPIAAVMLMLPGLASVAIGTGAALFVGGIGLACYGEWYGESGEIWR